MQKIKKYKSSLKNESWMQDVSNADTVIVSNYRKEIENIDKGIKYCQDCIKNLLHYPEEKWQVNEYKSVIDDYKKRRQEIIKILNNLSTI
jgi:hypothetical protein